MKIRFSNRIKLFIVLIFIISLISSLFIYFIINLNPQINDSLKNDIFNVIFFALFFELSLVVLIFSLINTYLKKDLLPVKQMIIEFTKGNYNYTIEEPIVIDYEIEDVINKLQAMQESIRHYDNLKKEKIVEHRNRIIAMLNISDSGLIIFNMKGNILYISDLIKMFFPSIEENTNILNINYNQEIESTIKKVVIQIIKTSLKAEAQSHYFHNLKKHITIRSALVRDSKGLPIGYILSLVNLASIKKEISTNEVETSN
ncbi:MAG: hypothetical protein PHY08_02700 [Candidatus Cloacimonetes bacterium]|jgi:signal transduction histidine kinase|nr:hypothetical protein [Candidatus Cloacimonadota bacterium]MDD4155460.1 hypothetical protein [Candidatus Cloacimonadota bacterium]